MQQAGDDERLFLPLSLRKAAALLKGSGERGTAAGLGSGEGGAPLLRELQECSA